MDEQNQWLLKVQELLKKSDVGRENISWSAHFASLQNSTQLPEITALMPLYWDYAHSLAMVKNAMDVIRKTTHNVNEDTIPVITIV